jgi:P pilus assembly chaperone PapD
MKCSIFFLSLIASCCSLMLGSASAAYAQLGVNKVIVTFKGTDRPVKNVTVSNSANHPLYVTVKVERVVDLSIEPMSYEPADDLLISPKTFSVGPLGQRTVRILLKQAPAEKERAYRVILLPQASEFGDVEGATIKHKGRSVALHVLTGSGMVVYAEPAKLVKELVISREAKELILTNKGNIQVQYSSGVTCPESVKLSKDEIALALDFRNNEKLEQKGCIRFQGGKVHAGRSGSIKSPPDHRIIFGRRFGSDSEMEAFSIEPRSDQMALQG